MSRLTRIVFHLWVANFFLYVLVASLLGGDAVNGRAEAGHYFLANHGRTTEVSSTVFHFSLWYTYLLIAHFAVAAVCVVILVRADKSVTSDG